MDARRDREGIPNSSQQSGVVSWWSHSRRAGGGAQRPSASLRKWPRLGRETHRSGCADPHSLRGGSGGPECCRSLVPGRPTTSLVAGQHDAMSRVDGGTPGLADLFGSERESASVRMDFDCAL